MGTSDVAEIQTQITDILTKTRGSIQAFLTNYDTDTLQFWLNIHQDQMFKRDSSNRIFDALTSILEFLLIHTT